jgi:hypothetical protein
MSNEEYASFNGFFKLLGEAVTRSHYITCPHKDGGHIHPLTAELVQNAILEHHKVTRDETRYREAASRARSLIDLYGAMTDAEKSMTVSQPDALTSLHKVLDDLNEQDLDCVLSSCPSDQRETGSNRSGHRASIFPNDTRCRSTLPRTRKSTRVRS